MQACWNNLGFSLYAAPSVCYMVINSDNWLKFEREVSTDSGVLLFEHWRLSSIEIIFINYQYNVTTSLIYKSNS